MSSTLTRVIAGGVVAAILIVAALAAGWWFFLREDDELATNAPAIPGDLVAATASPAAPEPTSDGGATPAGVPDGGITYTIISERSEAAYFADEQLARLPLPSTAKGATDDITGAFHLTEDGFALNPAQPSVFTVDLSTLVSDEERRDSRVQDALNTAQFPTATFTATSVSGIEPPLEDGVEHAFKLTGTLELRGIEREVTWDVKAIREGGVMTALATLNFRYEEFGIPIPNIAGIVSVEEDVTLQVQVVAQAS